MNAVSAPSDSRTTFEAAYGLARLAGSVRALDAAMLAAWDGVPRGLIGRSPCAPLRADVMAGKKEPNKHILRMVYGAIDCGVSWEKATAWLDDVKRMAKQYAERKQGRERPVRILPFPVLWERLWTRETREQAEADMASIRVNEHDAKSLRSAEIEIQDHIDALKVKLELIQEQRVAIEAKG